MSISLASLSRGISIKAPRIMVAGVEGVGKSTFAASAPNPVFIPTEDGLGSINTTAFPLAKSEQDVLDAMGALYTEDHDFQTVVVDSVDWLETLIWRDIESKFDAKDLAYGKGAVIAADRWRTILDGLNALRDEKGMCVILLAHVHIKRFDSPETEPYDRYSPKLQERSSALVREWCDAVLFANWRTVVRKEEVGFNKTVSRGISTGERLLFTSEKPAYLAKNRYALPETLPLSWPALSDAISRSAQPAQAEAA